ncbi:GNAT family N-acetyltransferase [Nocardioides korecus]
MSELLRPLLPTDGQALDDVLALNERHVELTSPLSRERLLQLVGWADRACVVDVEGSFAGFVLTFASGSAYDGENFGWFGRWSRDHHPGDPDLAYLDRVVVHEDFRRRGLASQVYDELESTCGRSVMTLEVNLDPPNEPSLAFHRGRGYAEVGQRDSGGHLVSLMAKPLTGPA